MADTQYYGTGRRKSSTARGFLTSRYRQYSNQQTSN